ncbi:MAG: rhodanese-like domain-containing protein [Propionibacteriaceae bacterium]|nr:rhodanese-like domain-containing protein [Propionibacteriaceae bacterium]
MSRSDYLATAAQLGHAQVIDVRWQLNEPPGTGRAAYEAGHIPGALFLSLEDVLTQPNPDKTLGRHPMPTAEHLSVGLGQLGIDPARPIVVYDEPGTSAAARAWWVLRWAGLDVRVLDGGWPAVRDGGWPAWLASGAEPETGPRAAPPVTVQLTTGHLPTIYADAIPTWPGSLVDVRAAERYRGEVEPIDAKAGHIPGAVNRPVAALWDAQGAMPDDETLKAYFCDLKEPLALYCGSGVSACQGILALAVIGIEATLYPPSWSGWSADQLHEVATG